MIRAFLIGFLSLALTAPAYAQSQSTDGSIEGTVVDTSGGVLPGVTVTLTNIATGTQRVVVTNEGGLYRALLLPLGDYRIKAELPKGYMPAGTYAQIKPGESCDLRYVWAIRDGHH